MSHLAIIIVTWNSARHLRATLASLQEQTNQRFDLIVVDNASTDATVEIARAEYPTALIIKNSKNRGYGRAFNQGVSYVQAQLAKGDSNHLVASLSAGVLLHPEALRQLLDAANRQGEFGSATGPLYRAWIEWEDETQPLVKSDVIAVAGLALLRSGRVVERFAGLLDDGKLFAGRAPVFGPPGAFGLYRLGALMDAAEQGKALDERFGLGYEHEDLAWRLGLLGHRSLFVPEAGGWLIGESGKAARKVTLTHDLRRTLASSFLTRKAFASQLRSAFCNTYFANCLLDWPWHAAVFAARSLWLLGHRPGALAGAYRDLLVTLPDAWRRRWRLLRRAKASVRDVRSWYDV
jgi:GT2 family glycosyltransferase